ncbi:hypothetical protein PHLGIDRAFT_121400 [Phlebiopsis gigantea 11061_1 CR5-6]|uniref:DUF6533 domain-containing protein n=1 Tax=Phlebiopsis gigantea (strain 11061_1 CR5-6) TaxID=745531 RepID=A0A0C3RT02_PHLG1|nr:hypothetical protein PHLGIDRAFT_121400 [Phlebiopsis gigantea 11061_1 CR5-6]
MALEGKQVTIAICVAVAFGIVAWDYFSLLPDELSLYRSRDKRMLRTPTTWLFILLRYSGILATLSSLFFTSVQIGHCQSAVVASTLGACLVVFSSGAIFSFRIFAIWHGNRIVYAIVVLAFALMMACWIAVATQYNAVTGAHTAVGSNCQMRAIVSWAPISYASSVLFDTTILVLTLLKLRPALMAKSYVSRQIFRDTLLYFALTTVTNVVVLSIQSLDTAHALLKPTAVPFSTVMTVTMGSRVYLNLKLLEQRRQAELDGLPVSVPLVSTGSTASSGDRSRVAPFAAPPSNRPSTQFTAGSSPPWEKDKVPGGMR